MPLLILSNKGSFIDESAAFCFHGDKGFFFEGDKG
jgi:hypothetical protein